MESGADFTSSLYLGMGHAAGSLPGWSALTTGRPAVLGHPPGANAVAARVAELVGAERATLARSTLHALIDCLEVLARPGAGLVVDGGVYPVGRAAVQRSAGAGVGVTWVAHHDVDATGVAVRRLRRLDLRPVVVADGVCTGCGRPYPLTAVSRVVHAAGGTMLIDDTQALGVLGADPGGRLPYGRGGGGSIRYAEVPSDPVVTVSSLAKAFGAPLACVAGPAGFVARVRTTGSALHSSPPSAVDVAAAAAALAINRRSGDALRARLADRVDTLRLVAAGHGVALRGGMFPVQSTPALPADAGRALLGRLARDGVQAVLRRRCGARPGDDRDTVVTLVVTAGHRRSEVERAARLLGLSWGGHGMGQVRRAH